MKITQWLRQDKYSTCIIWQNNNINDGNHLHRVADAMGSTVNAGFFDYKDAPVHYRYDDNGNVFYDANKGVFMTYNYLNLPYHIDRCPGSTIDYLYDAAGNKLQKKVVDVLTTPNKISITKYAGNFVYTNTYSAGNTPPTETLEFIGHEEGRIRPAKIDTTQPLTAANTKYIYDYFMKDHLGNTRMVLTTEQQTDLYAATNEPANASKEDSLFNNMQSVAKSSIETSGQHFDTDAANTQVTKLNGNNASTRVGQSIILKVMAGDVISIGTKAWYKDGTQPAVSGLRDAIHDQLLGIIDNGVIANGGIQHDAIPWADVDGGNYNLIYDFIDNYQPYNNSRPKAFLNWIIVDEEFKKVTSPYHLGAVQVPEITGSMEKQSLTGPANMTVRRNGWLYVYLSNESNQDVYFDDLVVNHKRRPIVEQTNYYPFGLEIPGLHSQAIGFGGNASNRFKFNSGSELQSKEFSDGSGLELYDAKNRMYDPQIGRFGQMDLLADMSQNISSFAFASNNPISINDPLGLSDSLPTVTVVGYIKNKASQVANWFTGANVGYNGSGWGHGPRQWLANQTGLGNNASNLFQLGMQSMLQNSHVNLTGQLLNKLQRDPALIAFQNKIIAALKLDPRFGKLAFITKGGQGVGFGGERWSSAKENWGALNGSNPALHEETWAVGGNELTWAVRHAEVDYTASVKSDGTIVISYHLSDQLDLSAQPGRSEAYNNISATTGFLYHDAAGGNSAMKVNADWQTTVK